MPETMTTTAPSASSVGDRRRWWALAVIAAGQMMVVLDVTIMNVALPSIGRTLDVSSADRHWVITAYTLTFAGLLLVGGRLADHLGRKRAFLIALAGFAAASAIGGAAANMGTLVAARAGQGMFGALLAPTALSLVATTFPDPQERGRAFGVFGVVMGGGAGLGLLLGGVLTESVSWRWALYINVPLALVAAAGAALVLVDREGREPARVDLLGAGLGTAGLVALVYGFSTASTHGWGAPVTTGTLVVGLLLLATFVLSQARQSHPLLPPGIVTHRSRGGSYLAFMLVMLGMFGMFLLVSFYLQTVAGYGALATGVAFLPFALANVLASMLVGRVMPHVRSGLLLAAGLLIAAAGMGWLTQLDVGSGYTSHVMPAVTLIGLGLGTLAPVAANLATFQVPERDAGVAGAVFNASEQVGASLGVALLNTIAATSTQTYLAAHPSGEAVRLAAQVHGYTTATAWAAAILTLGAILALTLVDARLGTPDEPPDIPLPASTVDPRATSEERIHA